MRLIDRWVGIPLCFFASFWPLKKAQADSNSTLAKNIPEKERQTLMKRLQSECPENPLKEIFHA